MFLDSNLLVFAIIDLNQHAFLVLKGMTPTFSNICNLLKIDIKNCPLLGKLLSVWRTVSVLPKSAQTAQSAQTVENSHSFFNVSYTWYKSLFETNMTKLNPKIALTQSIYIKYQFRFGCTKRKLANNFYFS